MPSYDQDAVNAAAELLRPEIEAVRAALQTAMDTLQKRVEALEARPDGGINQRSIIELNNILIDRLLAAADFDAEVEKIKAELTGGAV